MCGIAGILNWHSSVDAGRVRQMTQAMKHRGPDDTGLEVLGGGRVVLGHLRLSIIDLSPLGHQPMVSPSRASWIVYNGEIYNYAEIRAELEGFGVKFASHSDTEVILAAYERWGLDSVRRFRGMFAFALWDTRSEELHLCRDRFGVKPLFYSGNGSELGFASELRAFAAGKIGARDIDATAAAEFLQFGYVTGTRTLFGSVAQVPPGSTMTFSAKGVSAPKAFWSSEQLFDPREQLERRRHLASASDDVVLDELEEQLKTAFAYRMVADVPVGLFLSGGIDSSTVATVLARKCGVRLRTFTIGYGDGEFDETPFAREVAKLVDADHTEVILSGQAALDLVEKLPEIADEPIGDSSLIPTYLVSRVAREHVTVALSADGADELFGGYPRYQVCAAHMRRQGTWKAPIYSLAGHLVERLPASFISAAYNMSRGGGEKYAGINDKARKFARMMRQRTPVAAYEGASSEWTAEDARDLLAGNLRGRAALGKRQVPHAGLEPEEQFMYLDTANYLPGDLLTKVDRASMAVSLEAREPFLDPELARFAAALPLHWKIRDGKNKYALRRILGRHLPPALFERPKKGFSVPIAAWLRGPLRPMLTDLLSPEHVKKMGLLDPQTTQVMLRDFLDGGRNASPAGVWFLFQLQQWAGRWLHA